jgi:hypothetical protein
MSKELDHRHDILRRLWNLVLGGQRTFSTSHVWPPVRQPKIILFDWRTNSLRVQSNLPIRICFGTREFISIIQAFSSNPSIKTLNF